MAHFNLRTMTAKDNSEVAELIYLSLNIWHQLRGRSAVFTGGPRVAEIFHEVYSALNPPGCAVVAEHPETGRIMGSCFFHPRERHSSLGIMSVHPNYFGAGVAKALLEHICDTTDRAGIPSLRLTSSAINLDSFSLYTRAGFVPRMLFQEMLLKVPDVGIQRSVPGEDRVRAATADDVPAMTALELEVSGISRAGDFRYFLENALGFWHVSVFENARGGIDGFMVSSGHPAFNMLGPCVTRTEEQALALIRRELDHHKGRTPVFLVPVECEKIVRAMYDWGACNFELHVCQVRGRFQPFRGVSMPTFLPETS